MARKSLISRAAEAAGKSLIRWGNSYNGGLTQGGIVNHVTGLGTSVDKVENTFFQPTRIHWKAPLEILYAQSQAAQKAVNIPIDDMFIRWRRFKSDNEKDVEIMEDAENQFQLKRALAGAMKAADVYGSGLLVIMSNESELTDEFFPERVRPGDLKSLVWLDRYEASYYNWDRDMMSPHYGEPEIYNLHPHIGIGKQVHRSRVIRFDGITSPSKSGFASYYDQIWGISSLIPIVNSLLQDASLAQGIAHLSQEASVSILKVQGLRDLMAGRVADGEATAQEIGQQINEYKSIFNMLMIEGGGVEEFERVSVQFGGLADLMDKFPQRIASARDIPMTRWNGQSPRGMNSTGESDMRNYVMMVESKRMNKLDKHIKVLDEVLSRNAGLAEPPEYEWLSLMDQSEMEQAEVAMKKTEAIEKALAAGLIDEDEGRAMLDGDDIFGELPGDAPEPNPVLNPVAQQFEMDNKKLEQQQKNDAEKAKAMKDKPPGGIPPGAVPPKAPGKNKDGKAPPNA